MLFEFNLTGRLDKYPTWQCIKERANGTKIWQFDSIINVRFTKTSDTRSVPFRVLNWDAQGILMKKADENNHCLVSGYCDREKNGDIIWLVNECLPFHPTKYKRTVPDYRKLTAEMYALSSQKSITTDFGDLWIVNCIAISSGKAIRIRLSCPTFNEHIAKGTHLLVMGKITKFGKWEIGVMARKNITVLRTKGKRSAKEVFAEINVNATLPENIVEHDAETGVTWVS